MPSLSASKVSVMAHISSKRYQSVLLRARQARDLQPEQDAHSPERDLSIQVIKSGAFYKHLARYTKIFDDDGYLVLGPAQRHCFLH
jgi:hypothetical protein